MESTSDSKCNYLRSVAARLTMFVSNDSLVEALAEPGGSAADEHELHIVLGHPSPSSRSSRRRLRAFELLHGRNEVILARLSLMHTQHTQHIHSHTGD